MSSYSQVQCDGMNIIVRDGKVTINGVDALTGKRSELVYALGALITFGVGIFIGVCIAI